MKKKSIVITGSTSGIGRGLAVEFLKRGHQVIINGRSSEKVEESVCSLKKINPDVVGVAGSVTIQATHEKLIAQAVSAFGKIDIWINNAGIPQPHKLFVELDENHLKNVIETNIFGLMLGTKTAAVFMIKQSFGKIFNMEGFGSNGRIMQKLTLYGTRKSAVYYFTKSFAKEMEGSPVQVGSLSPGMVRTDFLTHSLKGVSMTPKETKRFKRVYDILAEDVELVATFLVTRILKSKKNHARIKYLTKNRLFVKLLKMAVSR